MNNKEIKAPIGLLIIAIFGVITMISMVSTLKKFTNYDEINYNESK